MEKSNLVRADYYTGKNKYIVFVGGYSINSKEGCPEVANQIAKRAGQTSYKETTYGGVPPVTKDIEVY
jgi:hypothetical protein